jgi:cellulose biosynthesis protein BcsQ/predicted  nucleic acid-binding Zn-ribbon protein
MTLSETTQTLAVLGPIFGVVSTVLGALLWLTRRHIQGKDDQITQLKQDRDELTRRLKSQEDDYETKLAQAEARFAKLKVDLDVAAADLIHHKALIKPLNDQLEDARAKRKDVSETARKNFDAWNREKGQREKAEEQAKALAARVERLDADLKELGSQLEALKVTAADATSARVAAEAKTERAAEKLAVAQKKTKELQAQINGVIKQDGRVWRRPLPADLPPFVPLAERGTPIISVLNLKGGVGKTTITANLAGYLAGMGKRILMVDVDHQRSLSQLVLSAKDRKSAAAAGHTIQHFLTSPTRDGNALMAAAEAVPNLDNVWVITTDDVNEGAGGQRSLDDLEMHLLGEWLITPDAADARFLMRQALQSDIVRGKFDYVFVDCPPRLTTACVNALAASDFVLTPIQIESVSIRSVHHLLRRLRELRDDSILPDLRILGLVANMVASRVSDKDPHEVKLLSNAGHSASSIWGQHVPTFNTRLARGHQYAEATRRLDDGEPLRLAVSYPAIRVQYQELMAEIEGRIHENLGLATVPS